MIRCQSSRFPPNVAFAFEFARNKPKISVPLVKLGVLGLSSVLKFVCVVVALGFSAGAFAQTATPRPKAGSKPLVQVKPKAKGPAGCKLVGTVRGTKLWAGDCVSSELRGTTSPTTETQPAPAPEAIPPGQKE
jgi:hypothetical protein